MKFDAEKPYDHHEFGIKEKGEGGKHFMAYMIEVDEEHEWENMLDPGSNIEHKGSQVVDQSPDPRDSDAYYFSVNLDPLSCSNNACGCTEAPCVNANSEKTLIAKNDLLCRDKAIIEVETPHALLYTGNGVCPTPKDICIDEASQSFDNGLNFDQQISSSLNISELYIGAAFIQESSKVARNDDVKTGAASEVQSSLTSTLEDQDQNFLVKEGMKSIMNDSTNEDKHFMDQQSSSKLIFDLKKLDAIGSMASEICIKDISEKQALSLQELGTASITQDLYDVTDSRIEYQHAKISSECIHLFKEDKTAKLFVACAAINLQSTDMANAVSDDGKLRGMASTSNLHTEEASNVCIQNKMDVTKQENFLAQKDAQSEELILDDITSHCSSFSNLSHVESSLYHATIFSGPLVNSGHIPFSGSISLRSESSTTSARSFAFPVLQSEWNSSPVKMIKADKKQLRKVRGWKMTLACCKF